MIEVHKARIEDVKVGLFEHNSISCGGKSECEGWVTDISFAWKGNGANTDEHYTWHCDLSNPEEVNALKKMQISCKVFNAENLRGKEILIGTVRPFGQSVVYAIGKDLIRLHHKTHSNA